MKKLTSIVLGAVLLTGLTLQTRAADQVNPTGTYNWTQPGRNGGADRTNTLVLKLDGGQLTGKLSAPGRGGQISETEITDGKLAGAEVSFSVVRSFNNNTMTNKFTGMFADGVIKGKIESERNGQPQSRDWTATLQK